MKENWNSVEDSLPAPIEEWEANATNALLLKDTDGDLWIGWKLKYDDGEVIEGFRTNHPIASGLYPIHADITHWILMSDYAYLLRAAESMYHDLIALGQAVPEEAARIFGGKSNWIPKDQNPPEREIVWITIEVDGERSVVQGYLDYGKGWRLMQDADDFSVIGWQSIIKPAPMVESFGKAKLLNTEMKNWLYSLPNDNAAYNCPCGEMLYLLSGDDEINEWTHQHFSHRNK